VLCYFVSNALAASDPIHPVRNGDIIQLIHGMTERPLNRYLHCLNKGHRGSTESPNGLHSLQIVIMGCFTGWSLFLMFNQQCKVMQGRDSILCIEHWSFLGYCFSWTNAEFTSHYVYTGVLHWSLWSSEITCCWFVLLLFFCKEVHTFSTANHLSVQLYLNSCLGLAVIGWLNHRWHLPHLVDCI